MHQTARQPGQHVSARHQHTRTSRSVPVPKCAAAKDTQPVVLVPLASQTVAETSERVRAHIVALQQSTDWHALQACLQRAAALHQAACSRTQAAQAPAASPSVPPRPQQQTVDSFRARMAAARTKTQVHQLPCVLQHCIAKRHTLHCCETKLRRLAGEFAARMH